MKEWRLWEEGLSFQSLCGNFASECELSQQIFYFSAFHFAALAASNEGNGVSMKLSIIIPVYYNELNLLPLYEDLKEKVINKIDYEYEIVMVDDGSQDNSFGVMRSLAAKDHNIITIRLSRNFGSHAAILCGFDHCTGDCAVVKAADLQEPSELILDMVKSWQDGNNVVLAIRESREEGKNQVAFADLYYWLVRKTSLPSMPQHGFDIYLIDRKVINVLSSLDERNSALTGQVLWSGFKTGYVKYVRKAREIGKSRWTLKKKIKLIADTLYSFSTVPIHIVLGIGALSFFGATIWSIIILIFRLTGRIAVSGWSLMFIFQLFSFGVIMITLGILGEYLWRSFDASRNRPPYIVEYDENEDTYDKNGRYSCPDNQSADGAEQS